jgi:hypothetical protein
VPKNANVVLKCEVLAGELDCLGQSRGSDSEVEIEDNGGPGGLDIELDVEVTAGHVEVRRV